MKWLCLAYGSEKDWKLLSEAEQAALLAQDEVLRRRGDLVAAVRDEPIVLRAWSGTASTSKGPLGGSPLPLAGAGIVEAASLDELIGLLKDTPCARAGGAIEIRPIAQMNLPDWRRPADTGHAFD
jgi:hypothetical protein